MSAFHDLSPVEQAYYLLDRTLERMMPERSFGMRTVKDYDGIDSDGITTAIELDGRYWLYFARECIEVKSIRGNVMVDGWVLESIEPPSKGYMATMDPELPAPIPEVDRRARSLTDIVPEIVGLLARGWAYDRVFNEMLYLEEADC